MAGYEHGGWKKKYRITKLSGNPVDPKAEYFVLRLDKDPHARKAALAYATSVRSVNEEFAADIENIIRGITDGVSDANWVYKNNFTNTERYVLGQWGDNPLVCIGINPSTAEPGRLDNTLRRVKGFANELGHDGWLMVNVTPQRATKPDDLALDNLSEVINRNRIIEYVGRIKEPVIWCAWGTLITKRPYLADCLDRIVRDLQSILNPRWITIGKRSVKEHPHHPLYLAKGSVVQDFDINEYLKKLKMTNAQV